MEVSYEPRRNGAMPGLAGSNWQAEGATEAMEATERHGTNTFLISCWVLHASRCLSNICTMSFQYNILLQCHI